MALSHQAGLVTSVRFSSLPTRTKGPSYDKDVNGTTALTTPPAAPVVAVAPPPRPVDLVPSTVSTTSNNTTSVLTTPPAALVVVTVTSPAPRPDASDTSSSVAASIMKTAPNATSSVDPDAWQVSQWTATPTPATPVNVNPKDAQTWAAVIDPSPIGPVDDVNPSVQPIPGPAPQDLAVLLKPPLPTNDPAALDQMLRFANEETVMSMSLKPGPINFDPALVAKITQYQDWQKKSTIDTGNIKAGIDASLAALVDTTGYGSLGQFPVKQNPAATDAKVAAFDAQAAAQQDAALQHYASINPPPFLMTNTEDDQGSSFGSFMVAGMAGTKIGDVLLPHMTGPVGKVLAPAVMAVPSGITYSELEQLQGREGLTASAAVESAPFRYLANATALAGVYDVVNGVATAMVPGVGMTAKLAQFALTHAGTAAIYSPLYEKFGPADPQKTVLDEISSNSDLAISAMNNLSQNAFAKVLEGQAAGATTPQPTVVPQTGVGGSSVEMTVSSAQTPKPAVHLDDASFTIASHEGTAVTSAQTVSSTSRSIASSDSGNNQTGLDADDMAAAIWFVNECANHGGDPDLVFKMDPDLIPDGFEDEVSYLKMTGFDVMNPALDEVIDEFRFVNEEAVVAAANIDLSA